MVIVKITQEPIVVWFESNRKYPNLYGDKLMLLEMNTSIMIVPGDKRKGVRYNFCDKTA